MIAGRAAPELADRRYLDIIGVNFYAANQWESRAAANSTGTPAPTTRGGVRSTCCSRGRSATSGR